MYSTHRVHIDQYMPLSIDDNCPVESRRAEYFFEWRTKERHLTIIIIGQMSSHFFVGGNV